MTAFIIFGATTLAIIFFLLHLFFNVLNSIIEALKDTFLYIIGITGIAVLIYLIISILVEFINSTHSFWYVVGSLILPAIGVIIVLAIISFLGEIIGEVLLVIGEKIEDLATFFARICEERFTFFVKVITNKINMQ